MIKLIHVPNYLYFDEYVSSKPTPNYEINFFRRSLSSEVIVGIFNVYPTCELECTVQINQFIFRFEEILMYLMEVFDVEGRHAFMCSIFRSSYVYY